MRSDRKNFSVFTATAITLLLGLAILESMIGSGAEELHLLLRITGRISLLIFLLVFIARPLHQLRVSPASKVLLKHRRSIGIAFASSHTVHLALIFWLAESVPEESFDLVTILVGGGGFVLMYLMLITSFDGPARAIGPIAWHRLHRTGLYWIGFIFAVDFFVKPWSQPSILPYLPFSILVFLAISVRVAAWRGIRQTALAEAARQG